MDSQRYRTWITDIERIAADDPTKIAISMTASGEEISFTDLLVEARTEAAELRNSSVQFGDFVLLISGSSIEYIVALMALHFLGAVAVTANTAGTPDELRYQADECNAQTVLVDADREEIARTTWGESKRIRRITRSRRPEVARGFVPAAIDQDTIATVIYTSGTTSRPKGVMLSQGNYVWNNDVGRVVNGYRDDDRALLVFPLHQSNGHLYQLVTWLTSGTTVVIVPKFSASSFIKQVAEHRVTISSLNAFHIKVILGTAVSEDDKDTTLRFVKLGTSASLDSERLDEFCQRFNVRVLGGTYSQTETIAHNIACPNEPKCLSRMTRGGVPQAGYEVKIVTDDGSQADTGESGEIAVKPLHRHGLTPGYVGIGRPEEVYRDGWWFTGDMGMFDEHGFMVFLDRKKDMIKRAGYNVSPADVERVLLEHPSVREVAVVGVPDQLFDELIVAFVTPAHGEIDVSALSDRCLEELSKFKQPDEIHVIDVIPTNVTGKIDKENLKRRAVAMPRAS